MIQRSLSIFSILLSFSALAGCGSPPSAQTRGLFSSASPVSVREITPSTGGKTVQISGVIVEKCPVAGCWFILKDNTGTVRVDTKSAGFVISDLPLQTRVTVVGKVASGETPGLSAVGLQSP